MFEKMHTPMHLEDCISWIYDIIFHLPINEDDAKTGNERQVPLANQLFGKSGSEILEEQSNIVANEESLPVDFPDCVVKCKSAFKCRICPRVVCLSEETLRAHLKSKVRCVA